MRCKPRSRVTDVLGVLEAHAAEGGWCRRQARKSGQVEVGRQLRGPSRVAWPAKCLRERQDGPTPMFSWRGGMLEGLEKGLERGGGRRKRWSAA